MFARIAEAFGNESYGNLINLLTSPFFSPNISTFGLDSADSGWCCSRTGRIMSERRPVHLPVPLLGNISWKRPWRKPANQQPFLTWIEFQQLNFENT